MILHKLLASIVIVVTITSGVVSTWTEGVSKTKQNPQTKQIIEETQSAVPPQKTLIPTLDDFVVKQESIEQTSMGEPTISETPIPLIQDVVNTDQNTKKDELTKQTHIEKTPELPPPPPQPKPPTIKHIVKEKPPIPTIPKIKPKGELWKEADFNKSVLSGKYSQLVATTGSKEGYVQIAPIGIKPVDQKKVKGVDNSDVVQLEWDPKDGYFDINKKFNGKDDRLCNAAVVTNSIYQWLRNNKQNIEKYINDYGQGNSLGGKTHLRTLINHPFDREEDLLFRQWIMKRHQRTAVYFEEIINWFFYGDNKFTDNQMGFFKDLFDTVYGSKPPVPLFRHFFQSHEMATKTSKSWSDFIKEGLEKGMPIGISYSSAKIRGGHIVTIWQAEFDENGDLYAVWISDSDDEHFPGNENKSNTKKIKSVGLQKMFINNKQYSYANVFGISYKKEDGYGADITNLRYLDIEEDIFQKYFEIKNKQKSSE